MVIVPVGEGWWRVGKVGRWEECDFYFFILFPPVSTLLYFYDTSAQ